jgi:hypothetical protein
LLWKERAAQGEKPPPAGTVTVNSGRTFSAPVKAAYSKARRHDPFQINAYQGDDKELIDALLVLAKTVMPAWQQVMQGRGKLIELDVLQQLAAGLQEANLHELALPLRQVVVARRGRYDPSDHPFITTSLRQLVPGAQAEQTLQRLAGAPRCAAADCAR